MRVSQGNIKNYIVRHLSFLFDVTYSLSCECVPPTRRGEIKLETRITRDGDSLRTQRKRPPNVNATLQICMSVCVSVCSLCFMVV